MWPIFRRIVAIPPPDLGPQPLRWRHHDVSQDHPCSRWDDDLTMKVVSHAPVCNKRRSHVVMMHHPGGRTGSGRSCSKFFSLHLWSDCLKMLGHQDRVKIPLEPHPGAGLLKSYSVIRFQTGLQSNDLLKAHLASFSGSLSRELSEPRPRCAWAIACSSPAMCAHNRERGSADTAPSGAAVSYGHVLSDRPIPQSKPAKFPVTYMAN